MFAWMQPQKKPLLGIDISSSSIKLLELHQEGSHYHVESYGTAVLPPQAVIENEIKDIEIVAQVIADLVQKTKARSAFGAIAMPGSAVITKTIQLQKELNDEDIAATLALDLERYIPYPMEEVNLDFQVLGQNAKNPDLNDILLAASRTENIDPRVEVLMMGGITAKVVDLEAYAIERAFSLIIPELPEGIAKKVVAVVDIGATVMTLSVLSGGSTLYTRSQIFGGKQLTEEIQRRYDLTFQQAFTRQKEGGLPQDYEVEVLDPFRISVAQQVSRSLQLFFSSGYDLQVDHLVLAGGVARIPKIDRVVSEKLQTPTSIANPFVEMTLSSKVNQKELLNDAPSLLICCGLALRSFSS